MDQRRWWFLLSMREDGYGSPRVEATCRMDIAMAGLLRVYLSQAHTMSWTCVLSVDDVGDATSRSALAVALGRMVLGGPLWRRVGERMDDIGRDGMDWTGTSDEEIQTAWARVRE